ncbi:hypothetical protein Q8F55_000064 [Vanrija albida]|uniref:F-box domain-containing protein n=1 Tax=Vanrija albida TaxID=181172 RepID=A0ABR3QC74_9TREE
MAPATLDSTAYPHIIDAILAACDTPTAIAFRGASRAFRAAVDSALLTHVALYVLPPPDPPLPHPDPHDQSTPIIRFGRPSDSSAPAPALLPNLPAAIRVLDIDHPYASSASNFARVHTLRCTSNAVWCRPPLDDLRTVVDFATPHDKLNQGDDDVRLVIQPRLQRYVLHISWDESRWDEVGATISTQTTTHMATCQPTVPREMVLVLHPFSSGPAAAYTHVIWFLHNLASDLLDVLDAGGGVCVVGVEAVSPLNMGSSDEQPDRLGLFKDMLLHFWRSWKDAPFQEALAASLAQIEFRTVTEWHAELKARGRDGDGLDAYGLQAVWPRSTTHTFHTLHTLHR